MSEFKAINQHNIRNIFLSLYEQTNAEILLDRYIFSNIDEIKTDFPLLIEILDILFDIIAHNSIKNNQKIHLSKNTEKELKNLVLSLGSLLLSQLSVEEKQHTNNESGKLLSLEFHIDVEFVRKQFSENTEESTMENKIDLIHTYLLKKVMHTGCISWAKSLLQPNLQQLIRNNWISKLLTSGGERFYPEYVYVEALQQIPWSEVQKMSTDETQKFILLPLQQAFKRFYSTGYSKLILLIGKLVLQTVSLFPSEGTKCCAMLTRSPSNCSSLLSVLYPLFPWYILSTEDSLLVFIELYKLETVENFQNYLTLEESKKVEHRIQFVNELLKNQNFITEAYQIELNLERVHYPHFKAFNKISKINPTLQKLWFEELFYFSYEPINLGLPLSKWIPSLKQEAQKEIIDICKSSEGVKYLSQLIELIATHFTIIDTQSLVWVLNPSIFENWKCDTKSIQWISFLMCYRNIFVPEEQSHLLSEVNFWRDICLLRPTNVQQTQLELLRRFNGYILGFNIWQSINWKNESVLDKLKGMMILLSSKTIGLPSDQIFLFLLSEQIGLFYTSFNNPKTKKEILLELKNAKPWLDTILNLQEEEMLCRDEIEVAKVMLALYLTSLNVQMDLGEGDEIYSPQWLEIQYSIFPRIQRVLLKFSNKPQFGVCILQALFSLMRFKPLMKSNFLADVLSNFLGKNDNSTDSKNRYFLVDKLMKDSLACKNSRDELSNSKNRRLWIQVWASVLSQKIFSPNTNHFFCLLFETLINITFHERSNWSALFDTISSQHFEREEIIKFSSKFPWISYAYAQAYEPLYPHTFGEFEKSSLGLLQLIGRQTISQNASLSLIFWEKFWELYFAKKSVEDRRHLVPPTLKEELKLLFIQVSQAFVNVPAIANLFVSFSSFSEDKIVENGSFFKNSHILQAFTILNPPFLILAQNEQSHVSHFHNFSPNLSMIPNQKGLDIFEKDSIERFLVITKKNLAMLLGQREELPQETYKKKIKEEELRKSNLNKLYNSISSNLENDKQVFASSEELTSILSLYYELGDKVYKSDIHFLELSRNLFFNHPRNQTVKLFCERGKNFCQGPASLNVVSYLSAPISPTLKDEIARNRELMSTYYGSLFEQSRALANYTVLLEQLSLKAQQSDSEKVPLSLFFSLLQIIVLNYLPPYSPPTSKIIRLTYNLGKNILKPENQIQFLHNFLNASSNSNITEHTLITQKQSDLLLENEEDNILLNRFFENRQILLHLFTPTQFLSNNTEQYLEMLKKVTSSPLKLTRQEESQLFSSFDLENSVQTILSKNNPSDIERLINLAPYLLRFEETNKFAGNVLQKLFALDFPKNLQKTFSSLFTASKQKIDGRSIITSYDPKWFLEIDWKQIPIETLRSISRLLKADLPFNENFSIPSLVYFASKIFLLENYLVNLIQCSKEKKNPSETNNEISQELDLWDEMISIINGILAPFTEGRRKVKDILPVLQLIKSISHSSEDPSLINNIWYWYEKSFYNQVVSYRHHDQGIISEALTSFDWSKADFHKVDPRSFSKIRFYITKHKDFILKLIEKLDWTNLDQYITNDNALHFLLLYLDTNVLRCDNLIFDNTDKEKKISEQKIQFVRNLFQWKNLDENFVLNFLKSNNFLIEMIISGQVQIDPTDQVLENISILRSTISSMNQPQLHAAFIRQVRSILFFNTVNQQGHYWYLSFDSHVSIISQILIPSSRISFPNSDCTLRILTDLLSCIGENLWQEPIPTSSVLSVTTESPSKLVNENKDMQKRIHGLICQNFSTAPKEICLINLSLSPKLIESPVILFPILEISLRTYFTHCDEDENPLATVSQALQLSSAVPAHHSMACVSTQSSMTLVVVLEKQRTEYNNLPNPDWLNQFAIPSLGYIASFQLNSNYILDGLSLWLYSLSIVNDKRFPFYDVNYLPNVNTIEGKAFDSLKKLRALFSPNNPIYTTLSKNFMTSRLKIASSACLLYLERIIFEKGKNVDLNKMNYSLNNLKTQLFYHKKLTENKECKTFFDSAETFLSPLCTLNNFQNEVTGGLIPMLPYLKTIFRIKENN